MVEIIRELLARADFTPFVIRTSDGREYPVRGRDCAHVSPKGGRVVVFDEEDRQFSLSSLHLSAVGESVA